MNWTLLGIAPTNDKKSITAAYREQLSHTNPEDKPEEFKALRLAYEEALKLAEQDDTDSVRDDSPIGIWTAQIRMLYDNFKRRIQPENWEELLNADVCTALDSRPMAEEALLTFLMQDFYIPHSVWQTLDRAFSWKERLEELYETYPREFIDYAVMSGIRYPDNLPYELFDPGIDGRECDEYRRLYYKTSRSDAEEMPQLLEQMNGFSESHPYSELLSYQLMVENGETERGLAGYKKLADDYPQDAKLQMEWAAQCLDRENWSEAESYVRRALELRPDSEQASEMLAKCLAAQGEYEEAKKLIFLLMDAAGGDQKRIYELHQVLKDLNEALIQDLESRVQSAPENMKLRSELAWCYLQNERESDALQLCQTISPDYEDHYDYHNLLAKIYYYQDDYDTALSHMQATEEILRTMDPDGTEETDDRIKSLPEKLQLQGSCLTKLNRIEEAVSKYEQALELAPDDPEILTRMGRFMCFIDDRARAAEIFRKVTNLLPSAYHVFYLLSQTLFELGQDRDAFTAVNRALDLEGGDLCVYVLKMQILLRNGAWEGVRDTLDFLRENGVDDEINTVWCEAQLLDQGEENKEEALKLYRSLAARVENGEALEEASKLYFYLLCLEEEYLDVRKSEDRTKMLELAEKGLSHNENDFSCLEYKAWLLKIDGQREESLAIYHQLETVPRRTLNIEKELASLYYKDLNRDADKALHYYEMLIEHEEDPAYLFYAGTCCKYLNRYEEAERYFLRLQEIDPDDVDAYNGMSYLYDTMKRYEASLEQIDLMIKLVQDLEGDHSACYYHKVRILRRLNRPQEALAVIDELTEKYGNEDVFEEKFDIYCQFGLWEQAEALLNDWKKSGLKRNRLNAAAIDLDLFTGKIDKARAELQTEKLNEEDLERLTLLMGELDDDEDVQMSIWEKRAANNQDKTHELMNMAQTQWWCGNYDKAREYAQEGLIQLNELIPRNKRSEALYRSRRVIALAILGRFDEAVAELEVVRNLPLCEGCNYCLCKDADIFEANIEEIRGNWSRAMELYRFGAERWPDDMDFVAGIRRILRKGIDI